MAEQGKRPRVLVVGAGGIGGVVAGALAEGGDQALADVTALTTNETIARAVQNNGCRVVGVDGSKTIPLRCVSELSTGVAPFDWVLLATQPPQVEEAARRALPYLAPQGAMVCFQNGLCEARVERIVGPERVVGAVVAWGASMAEPGVYDRTSAGGFTLGRMDGRPDARLEQLAMLLEPIGPVQRTDNLAGARWSKLAINCAISTLGTIGGDRLGPLMLHRFVRRLALELMTECVHVARAEGVRLEKVSGTLDLEWLALTESDRRASASPSLFAKHTMLLAVGARYRKLRSSMLAAIERGRTPAVDFLNGEVVDRGKARGISTPVNTEGQALVHAIASGKERSSVATVEAYARRMGI